MYVLNICSITQKYAFISQAADTPPKAAVLKLKKSRPNSKQAMAQAGMLTGIGKSISWAYGF